MSKIKLGIALQNYFAAGEFITFNELIETAKLAEEMGLHSVWVWDHLLLGTKRYYPIHESFIVLSAIASHTSRVRLGTGVYLLALRNPLVVAKQLTTLDHLSNGRITLGVGAGWYEREFKACGTPFKKRGEILVRNIRIVKRLLTEEIVDGVYDGFEFDNVRVEPKPIQKPHPPIWLGGYVEKAFERVGMIGDGWISYLYTPSSFRRSWEKILNYARKYGRDVEGISNCAMVPALIASDRESGLAQVRAFADIYYSLPPWSECSVESAITGSKDECMQQIDWFIESGAKEIVLMPVYTKSSHIKEKVTELGKTLLS